jgi:mannose-1-phosphate guanylyltransferase
MKTQELLSNQITPAARPVPLEPRNATGERFTLVNGRAGPFKVVVKAKPFGSPARPPRSGQIPTWHDAAPASSPHHWGLVLAGGDGTRLRDLTRWISGDDRPKQFCPLLGNQTLFEATRQRAERCIPAEHILFALTRSHERYYRDLVQPGINSIVQPFNRGTAPAILYGLMHIQRADPDAIVSILPCDHYYSPETGFTSALETALEVAERYTDSLVLLGAPPKGPETEYGWIQTGEPMEGSELFRVQGFREKPTLAVAENLYRSGSLWNMFVMVGHVRTFLDIASSTAPELTRALKSHLTTLPVESQVRIPDHFYNQIAPTDFSRQVLTSVSHRLLALRLHDLEWSDLGDPYRVLATLVDRDGDLPSWAKLWSEPEDESHAAAASV